MSRHSSLALISLLLIALFVGGCRPDPELDDVSLDMAISRDMDVVLDQDGVDLHVSDFVDMVEDMSVLEVDLSSRDMADMSDMSNSDMSTSTRVPTCVALTPIGANVDFATPWQQAKQAGITEPGDININWSALETAPGQFVDPDAGVLSMWNTTLDGTRVALTLATMQTSEETVPADLDTGSAPGQFARYADAATAERYLAAFDHMLSLIPNLEPWVLAVGNEIDIAIATAQDPVLEAQVWQDYLTFLERVRFGVQSRRPELLVGVKLGWEAILGGDQRVLDLIAASDVLIVSYYPSHGNFQVKAVAELKQDVATIVARAQGKPIYFAEVGYPSGELNGSSEAQQAAFVSEMLRLHQQHSAQIETMCFVWMNDLADVVLDAEIERLRAVSEELAMNQSFISFLGTLGLRNQVGQDKPAFDVLRRWNMGGP